MNVILFNERGKIAWTPMVRTGNCGVIRQRAEFWVTKAGLLLPNNFPAVNLRRVINAQSTLIDVPGDDMWHHAAALLTPNGELMVLDTRADKARCQEGARYYVMQCYIPYSAGGCGGDKVNFCISNITLRQLGNAALELTKGDLYETLGIVERVSLSLVKRRNYRVETVDGLLKWVREEMIRQYGENILEESYPWHLIGAQPA